MSAMSEDEHGHDLAEQVLQSSLFDAIHARMPSLGLERAEVPAEVGLIEEVVHKLEWAKVIFNVGETEAELEMTRVDKHELEQLERVNEVVERAIAHKRTAREAALAARKFAFRGFNAEVYPAIVFALGYVYAPHIFQLATGLHKIIDSSATFVREYKSAWLDPEAHDGSSADEFWAEFNRDKATIATLAKTLTEAIKAHAKDKTRARPREELSHRHAENLESFYKRLIGIPHASSAESLGAAHLREVGGRSISNRTAARYNI